MDMNSSADGSVIVQSSCQSAPSTPPWFGEVALVVQYLRQHDILSALSEQVCFARRRFGHYEVIDFLAVLFGYAISGERTLEAFYQRLYPFAAAFMALFGRERLPARSTLSRFLAALPEEPVEVAFPWKAGRFSGHDFAFQPDGTLRCPAGQKLSAHERRREVDGSLRVVYAASIRSCRPCSLREQCQWLGKATTKPRQVSVLLHPLTVGSAPVRLP